MSQFRILPWQHAVLVQLYGQERADRAVRLMNGQGDPIAHLDAPFGCMAKRHKGAKPRARWWLPGHGCGDSLLCGECMNFARTWAGGRRRCPGCKTMFDGFVAFAGEPVLL